MIARTQAGHWHADRYTLTVTATKAAAAQLDGYVTSDQGYSLDVTGDEAVLLEPSNGSNYQACTALTVIPDPVVAYIHFAVNTVPDTGSLTIQKTDADTGKPLAGVTYRLLNADGTKVADVTTDSSGKAVLSDLPLGDYFYQELTAPEGYVLDSTKYAVTISTAALNVTESRTNAKLKGSIAIQKVDALGAPLAGAELLLEMSTEGQTWTEMSRKTTGADGLAKWDDLKLGTQYRIMEVKAPAGYTLLTEPVVLGTLTADSPDITVTACNNVGFVLPFTGGHGCIEPILFAALMLGMGAYFCGKSNSNKEKI